MGTPYLGEMKWISWNYAPKGWAFCNGQSLPINQNQPLFALFGTTFGGNGQTTFNLPDLRGRVAMDQGAGFLIGQAGGETAHTITIQELPAHIHTVMASATNGDSQAPAAHVLARTTNNLYGQFANLTTMAPAAVSNVGGSQPHDNMQPYLCLNAIVALQGIFPSRN